MGLPNNAHVKLGSYYFQLDGKADEPHIHDYESQYIQDSTIEGEAIPSSTATPNIITWAMDDWAGGAEVKYYDPDRPDAYWYGNNNPRIRGSVTSPPDVSAGTFTLTSTFVDNVDEIYVTPAGNKLWVASRRDVFYSSDGTTYNQWNSTAEFTANYHARGIATDGFRPWVVATDATTTKVRKIKTTTTETAAVSDRTFGISAFGMAQLAGYEFIWYGDRMVYYQINSTLPITHSASSNVIQIASFDSADVAAYTDYVGGVAAGETSVFAFLASSGITHVYEFYREPQTGAWIYKPAWTPPYGFTATHMTVASGIVYLLGNEGNQAVLYAMPIATRQPIKVSYVGQGYAGNSVTMTTRAIAPSYADQVILGVDDGTTTYIFVYDPNEDAISQLDTYAIGTYGKLRALATFQQQRIAFACASASTTVNVLRWKHDYDTPSRGWTVISPAYNFGYPFDEKALFGFQVVQDPSIAAGTVQVEYQIDEDGSWTSAGTTVAGTKYTNLDVATSNKKFRIIRLRVTGASGARAFSVTTRAYINSYQEVWRLRLRLQDETAGHNRPYSRAVQAGKLRDYLNTLITTRTPVTFLDGTRYDYNGQYTTHTVVVEAARVRTKPVGKANGGIAFEGSADVVLRSTTP